MMRHNYRTFLIMTGCIAVAVRFADAATIQLDVQQRDADGKTYSKPVTIDSLKTAIIAIDLWNSHPDPGWTARAEAMLPRMNQTFAIARELGMQVIFAPANVVENGAYNDHPRRQATVALPNASLPPPSGTLPTPPYQSQPGHMIPIGVTRPEFPQPAATAMHPDADLQNLPSDWIATPNSVQEVYNILAAKGITQLIYVGGATNMCMSYSREASIRPMVSRGFTNTLFVRDLTEAMSYNGRNPDNPNQVDLSMSPDKGTRDSIAFLEQKYCGSIDARQLLSHSPAYAYTSRISGENGLLSYWRMDGKQGYKAVKDVAANQGLWNADKVLLGQPGAIHGDADTAAVFNGSSAMVASPIWQANLPTNSNLKSLSSSSFTVEAWVQVDDLPDSMGWIISHDGGDNTKLDFSLGIQGDGSFCFNTRAGTAPDGDPANKLISSLKVSEESAEQNRWYHVVGVQDLARDVVELYVDGNLVALKNAVEGQGTIVDGALLLGGHGQVTLNGNGEIVGGISDYFVGALDEVAIYDRALSSREVYDHFHLGTTGHVPEPSCIAMLISASTAMAAYAWRKCKSEISK